MDLGGEGALKGFRVATRGGFVSGSVSHDFIESPAFIVFVYGGTLSVAALTQKVDRRCFIIGSHSVFSRPFEEKRKQFFFREVLLCIE